MSQTIAFAPVVQNVFASTVVQNDVIEITPLALSKPLTLVLANLESERITWEQGVYRTSNQALYAVLAQCLAIATADSNAMAKQRNEALEAFYKMRGYKYNKDAPVSSLVTKAVFGEINRSRLSTYSLVIRAAIKEKVMAGNFAEWVEKNGGVQEIRVAQSANFIQTKTKVALARQKIEHLPVLAVAQSEALSQLADANEMTKTCLLIASQDANGSFVIRGLTRSGGAISAAFAALYEEQKKAA